MNDKTMELHGIGVCIDLNSLKIRKKKKINKIKIEIKL